MNPMGGRPPKLSPEQADRAVRRYHLGKLNTPAAIAQDMGISKTLLNLLVRGYRPKRFRQ